MVSWLTESAPASLGCENDGNKVAGPKERPKDDFEGLGKPLLDGDGVNQAGVPHPGHREDDAL